MATQTFSLPAYPRHLHTVSEHRDPPLIRERITLPLTAFSPSPTKVHGTVAPPTTPQTTTEQKQLARNRGLLIVSNRLPISVERNAGGRYQYDKSSGGLVTGLSGIDQGDTSYFRWYGWPGLSVPDEEFGELESSLRENHNAVAVHLDGELAGMHYNGFSSRYSIPPASPDLLLY
jgi:hypothetical protein